MAIGVDIGSHTTRVAVVERKGGALRVHGYCRVPSGEVVGPEATPGRLREALVAAGVRRGSASLGVSGRDVILKISNYPPVPEWRLRLLVEYELGELSERAGGEILSAHRILTVPERTSSEFTALLALAKEPFVEARIALLEEAGLKLDTVLPSPVASGNAFALCAPEARGGGVVMVADVGEATTDVSLLHGTTLIFARNANFGGEAFTRAIIETFGVTWPTAVKMKHEDGSLLEEGLEQRAPRVQKVCRSLEGPAADLASLLRSSMKFGQAQLRIPDLEVSELILTGGCARLPGLDRVLSSTLRVPVRVWNPASLAAETLEPVGLAALRDDGCAAVTSIGLAAIGASSPGEAVTVQLLPERVERRRRFLHSQLFVLLAAGLSCLAALVWWWSAAHHAAVAQEEALRLDGQRQNLHELTLGVEEAIQERLQLLEQRRSWVTTVEPGRAFTLALHALRRLTPPDAWITEVSMKPPLRFTDAPVIHVSGFIRESTRSASTTYDELRRALEMSPSFTFTTLAMEHDDKGSLRFGFDLTFTGEGLTASEPAPLGE